MHDVEMSFRFRIRWQNRDLSHNLFYSQTHHNLCRLCNLFDCIESSLIQFILSLCSTEYSMMNVFKRLTQSQVLMLNNIVSGK